MINLREVRISISYFACAIAMILGIRLMTKYSFISNDAVKSGNIKIIPILIFTFMIFAIIPCIILSITHMVRALHYREVYNKEKHYAEWHYSEKVWTRNMINNFKVNNIVEVRSFNKAAVYYFIVVFMAFLLDFSLNTEDRKHITAYILITITVFFVFFARVMLRNLLSMIDHLLFTNRTIVIMESTVIVDGEIFDLNIPLKKEMISKHIRKGNLEIEYAVPARYSDRFSNKRYLDVKDIKKLIIPIPAGMGKEAEKYMDVPLPKKLDKC